jgi:release factor glutamine methyltransferase
MQAALSSHIIAGHRLELRLSDEAFQPTTVTHKLAELMEIPPGSQVLDLGCGQGPIAIICALRGAAHVTAIDVMPTACAFARENVQTAGVADRVSVKCGDLFEPVKGQMFDVIVNDVSGIADRAARLSPWYPPTIPTGGADGADVVLRMFDQCPDYLNPNGVLYFATSSLSNVPRIVGHARKVFGERVENVGTYRIPFCPELNEALPELEQLQREGKIAFESRRSRNLWTLELFRVRNTPPIK